MSKPRQTVADYMVVALSPVLIMALVGSLCFFLIEIFYRGKMAGSVNWVMFWFIIGIVLISRIAIESSNTHAAVYGFGLALATWLYMMASQPAWLLGMLLLAIVWFCAHKLVWDCTLIDEDQDSSGQGLLQKAATPATPVSPKDKSAKKPARKIKAPQNPGRWVVYFSLAALPLFGVGQMLLPGEATAARRGGFIFLSLYLAAALGLLVTTSFLGLRRYLRQRYLKMPPTIALAWLKFGVGVAVIVLVGAAFLPRPGANEAWTALHYQIDYQLRRASEYASPANPPGQGQGRPGNDPGGKQGSAPQPDQQPGNKPTAGRQQPNQTQSPPQTSPAPTAPTGPTGSIYNLLRIAFWIVAILVVGGWIFRRRYMLLEMIKSIIAAITEFIRKFLALNLTRKPAKKTEPVFVQPKFSSFAEYKNPFFAAKDSMWPPEKILIYSYEAVQVWAKEQGTAARPDETAREFCARLSQNYPQLDSHLNQLARLYAHAAYGKKVPPNSDLEPIKELWRLLPTAAVSQRLALSRT